MAIIIELRFGTFVFLLASALLFIGSSAEAKGCIEQIEYSSDSDASYRYLEAEQRRIYSRFPDTADPIARMQLAKPESIQIYNDIATKLAGQDCDENGENCVGSIELYAQILKSIVCDALPTRFESPLMLVALKNITSHLEETRKILYPSSSKIRIGSLPTGDVNGMALLPEGSVEPIIIIERDLFSFTGAFSKSIVDAIPISEINSQIVLGGSLDGVRTRLRENPEIVTNFADALRRTIEAGTPRGARERFLEANHVRLHARLVTRMDMFIVAHEYAHVILHHVKSPLQAENFIYRPGRGLVLETKDGGRTSNTSTIELIKNSKLQELEADEIGLRLMIEADLRSDNFNSVDVMTSMAAADLFFKLYDVIGIYQVQAGLPRVSNTSTHPTADERRDAADRLLATMVEGSDRLKDIPDIRDVLTIALGGLIEAADPLIRDSLKLPANVSFPENQRLPFEFH